MHLLSRAGVGSAWDRVGEPTESVSRSTSVVLARDEISFHVEMSMSGRNKCCGLKATGNGKQVSFDFYCRNAVFSFKCK